MAKSVKPEQKGTVLQTELAKREVLRLNNRESNHLTLESFNTRVHMHGHDVSHE